MVDRTRKTVLNEVESFDVNWTSLKYVKELVDRLISEHGEDAEIQKTQYPYDDGEYLAVFAKRPETDKEMEVRIKLEEDREKLQEERDRSEFKRLQKKFKDK